MKILEGKLENGKRVMFNVARIDSIIEHGINPKTQTVICFGTESYTVMASYDEIMRIGVRGFRHFL